MRLIDNAERALDAAHTAREALEREIRRVVIDEFVDDCFIPYVLFITKLFFNFLPFDFQINISGTPISSVVYFSVNFLFTAADLFGSSGRTNEQSLRATDGPHCRVSTHIILLHGHE